MSTRVTDPLTTTLRLGTPLALGLAVLATGCGGSPPASPPPPAAAAPPPAVAVAKPAPAPVMPKEPEPGPPLQPLTYEAKGRRDPFVPITVARDKPGLQVDSLKLAGVIRGRTLLALVEAPEGLGYILKPGDVLGDGRVTDITPSSITFAVAPKANQAATTVTRRLGAD